MPNKVEGQPEPMSRGSDAGVCTPPSASKPVLPLCQSPWGPTPSCLH